MDDVDKFLDRWRGCIGLGNETLDFRVELIAIIFAADRDDSGVCIWWMSEVRRDESVIGVKDE